MTPDSQLQENERDGVECFCCDLPVEERDPDPWEGRLDGYCERCALARCDAYPGECAMERRQW